MHLDIKWLEIVASFKPGFDVTGECVPIPDGHIRITACTKDDYARAGYHVIESEICNRKVFLIRGVPAEERRLFQAQGVRSGYLNSTPATG